MTKKVTDLTAVTSPSADALVYVLNSSASAPADRKAYIGNLVGVDYISGLKLEWLGTNSLRIGTGTAALPDGTLIRVTSAITLSSMSLVANTWYHLYLVSATSVEYSTTAPAGAYFGTARTKAGDTSRRYLGSVKTDASAQIYKFVHSVKTGVVSYNISLPLILTAGTATVKTAVSTVGYAPEAAGALQIVAIAGGSTLNIVNSVDENVYLIPANSRVIIPFAKNEIYYRNAASGGSSYLAIYGYALER